MRRHNKFHCYPIKITILKKNHSKGMQLITDAERNNATELGRRRFLKNERKEKNVLHRRVIAKN